MMTFSLLFFPHFTISIYFFRFGFSRRNGDATVTESDEKTARHLSINGNGYQCEHTCIWSPLVRLLDNWLYTILVLVPLQSCCYSITIYHCSSSTQEYRKYLFYDFHFVLGWLLVVSWETAVLNIYRNLFAWMFISILFKKKQQSI